jgi:alpha-glucosidase
MDEGAERRSVLLPSGVEWVHVWTGERFAGGATADVDAPLDGPPPLFARVGSAMLVDLAKGGWRPEPYRRGLWLFPPSDGEVRWTGMDDSGDGHGPVTRWHLTGHADADRVVVAVSRDGEGQGDITLLLPPGDGRILIVEGAASEPVEQDGRRGLRLTV